MGVPTARALGSVRHFLGRAATSTYIATATTFLVTALGLVCAL